MTTQKKVLKKSSLRFTADFPGLKGVNIMASQYPIEPFLVFTEYRMTQPVFGPHPHAGISVMTYMLPDSKESFINRDSNGDFSLIEPGGLHITQAGSGIHHDEFPKITGNETHGFQIWINHTEENRLAEPKAMHANSTEIPEIVTADAKVRILHGTYRDAAPAYKMLTDVTLLHIYVYPNARIELEAKEMAFAYGLSGTGKTNSEEITAQTLINYDTAGAIVNITAFENGLELMFATAAPLNEPIVYSGPFVMTTAEQMQETKRRYGSGKMGTLEPYRG
jgi:quercetin 2,3-dioxygenase